jgi:hypothetical protein
MIRKGIRPRFRLGPGRDADAAWRREFPFKRPWPVIAILAVLDVVFLFPAIATARQIGGFGGMESLFDLVGVVFLSAWLLGWSLAPLALTAALLVLLFGREVVTARPGTFRLEIGLPVAGFYVDYDVTRMRNLRLVRQGDVAAEAAGGKQKRSGHAWRGDYIAFDYGGESGAFGSRVEPLDLGEVESGIQAASGKKIRHGEATPDELESEWEPPPEVPPVVMVSEPAVADLPENRFSASVLLLVAANLVPLVGTVYFGWQLSNVMVLYWAESAVIGLFNVLKIVRIGGWPGLFAALFFLGHFGGFMAVHFLFIYGIFVEGFNAAGPGDDLSEVAALFASLWPGLLALFVSHAYSYFSNFLGRQEYRSRTVKDQMSDPYSRIVFMHLVLIFGGGLAMVLGEPTLVIIGVIVLKIVFDVRAHLKQHARGRGAGTVA